MPKYAITAPDGTHYDVETPDGVSADQALAQVQSMHPSEPSAVESLGANLMAVPRQLGLAGRHLWQGIGQTADIFTGPMVAGENALARAIQGPNAPQAAPLGQSAGEAADIIGLPKPATPTERVVGDASRALVGTGALAAAAPAATAISSILAGGEAGEAPGIVGTLARSLAANPASQATAATSSGITGGSVREAGGGPWQQFGASLAGGLAGGIGQSVAANAAESASASVRRLAASLRGGARQSVEDAVRSALGSQWSTLSGTAQNALIGDANDLVLSGQSLNPNAIARLAAYRNIGATPLMGDITQNPGLLTRQRNLAKQIANQNQGENLNPTSLPNIENANAAKVLQTIQAQGGGSPADAYTTGQGLVGAVTGENAARQAAVRAAYGMAEASAGRAIPLDRSGFLQDAWARLDKINRAPFLPTEVRTILNGLGQGQGQFDVNAIDNLKTILAAEAKNPNANVRMAVGAVRGALEDVKPAPVQTGSMLPATGQQAAALSQAAPLSDDALAAFDKARALSRSQKQWQESAPFVEDALSGIAPEQFVQKHVISGPIDQLEQLAAYTKGNPTLADAIKTQLVNYILKGGGAQEDVTRFSQKGMNDAFNRLGERRLGVFFSPSEIGQIKSSLAVAKYSQAQPIGSAVNNANTAAMLLGRVADMLGKGATIPVVGPMVAKPLQAGANMLEARQMKQIADALALAQRQPGAGFAPNISPLLLGALATSPQSQY